MNTAILKLVKTTKNFHKFDVVAPLLGSIYIPKEMMDPTPPDTLVIELPVETTV